MPIKFDQTINIGHLMTLTAMLISVIVSFAVLDRRISVLEERSNSAITAAAERQIEQRASLGEIKSDIKELQRSVNEVGRAVAAKPIADKP